MQTSTGQQLLQAIEDFKRDNPNYQRAVEIIEQCEPIVRAYAEWEARPYGLYALSSGGTTSRKIGPPSPLQDPGYVEVVRGGLLNHQLIPLVVTWIIVGVMMALVLLR